MWSGTFTRLPVLHKYLLGDWLLLLLSRFSCVRLCATPYRRWPTRLPRPWDSPGKKTGVGCHFLLQCMKVKSESEVTQLCPTLGDPWTAVYQAPPSLGFSRQEYWRLGLIRRIIEEIASPLQLASGYMLWILRAKRHGLLLVWLLTVEFQERGL